MRIIASFALLAALVAGTPETIIVRQTTSPLTVSFAISGTNVVPIMQQTTSSVGSSSASTNHTPASTSTTSALQSTSPSKTQSQSDVLLRTTYSDDAQSAIKAIRKLLSIPSKVLHQSTSSTSANASSSNESDTKSSDVPFIDHDMPYQNQLWSEKYERNPAKALSVDKSHTPTQKDSFFISDQSKDSASSDEIITTLVDGVLVIGPHDAIFSSEATDVIIRTKSIMIPQDDMDIVSSQSTSDALRLQSPLSSDKETTNQQITYITQTIIPISERALVETSTKTYSSPESFSSPRDEKTGLFAPTPVTSTTMPMIHPVNSDTTPPSNPAQLQPFQDQQTQYDGYPSSMTTPMDTSSTTYFSGSNTTPLDSNLSQLSSPSTQQPAQMQPFPAEQMQTSQQTTTSEMQSMLLNTPGQVITILPPSPPSKSSSSTQSQQQSQGFSVTSSITSDFTFDKMGNPTNTPITSQGGCLHSSFSPDQHQQQPIWTQLPPRQSTSQDPHQQILYPPLPQPLYSGNPNSQGLTQGPSQTPEQYTIITNINIGTTEVPFTGSIPNQLVPELKGYPPFQNDNARPATIINQSPNYVPEGRPVPIIASSESDDEFNTISLYTSTIRDTELIKTARKKSAWSPSSWTAPGLNPTGWHIQRFGTESAGVLGTFVSRVPAPVSAPFVASNRLYSLNAVPTETRRGFLGMYDQSEMGFRNRVSIPEQQEKVNIYKLPVAENIFKNGQRFPGAPASISTNHVNSIVNTHIWERSNIEPDRLAPVSPSPIVGRVQGDPVPRNVIQNIPRASETIIISNGLNQPPPIYNNLLIPTLAAPHPDSPVEYTIIKPLVTDLPQAQYPMSISISRPLVPARFECPYDTGASSYSTIGVLTMINQQAPILGHDFNSQPAAIINTVITKADLVLTERVNLLSPPTKSTHEAAVRVEETLETPLLKVSVSPTKSVSHTSAPSGIAVITASVKIPRSNVSAVNISVTLFPSNLFSSMMHTSVSSKVSVSQSRASSSATSNASPDSPTPSAESASSLEYSPISVSVQSSTSVSQESSSRLSSAESQPSTSAAQTNVPDFMPQPQPLILNNGFASPFGINGNIISPWQVWRGPPPGPDGTNYIPLQKMNAVLPMPPPNAFPGPNLGPPLNTFPGPNLGPPPNIFPGPNLGPQSPPILPLQPPLHLNLQPPSPYQSPSPFQPQPQPQPQIQPPIQPTSPLQLAPSIIDPFIEPLEPSIMPSFDLVPDTPSTSALPPVSVPAFTVDQSSNQAFLPFDSFPSLSKAVEFSKDTTPFYTRYNTPRQEYNPDNRHHMRNQDMNQQLIAQQPDIGLTTQLNSNEGQSTSITFDKEDPKPFGPEIEYPKPLYPGREHMKATDSEKERPKSSDTEIEYPSAIRTDDGYTRSSSFNWSPLFTSPDILSPTTLVSESSSPKHFDSGTWSPRPRSEIWNQNSYNEVWSQKPRTQIWSTKLLPHLESVYPRPFYPDREYQRPPRLEKGFLKPFRHDTDDLKAIGPDRKDDDLSFKSEAHFNNDDLYEISKPIEYRPNVPTAHIPVDYSMPTGHLGNDVESVVSLYSVRNKNKIQLNGPCSHFTEIIEEPEVPNNDGNDPQKSYSEAIQFPAKRIDSLNIPLIPGPFAGETNGPYGQFQPVQSTTCNTFSHNRNAGWRINASSTSATSEQNDDDSNDQTQTYSSTSVSSDNENEESDVTSQQSSSSTYPLLLDQNDLDGESTSTSYQLRANSSDNENDEREGSPQQSSSSSDSAFFDQNDSDSEATSRIYPSTGISSDNENDEGSMTESLSNVQRSINESLGLSNGEFPTSISKTKDSLLDPLGFPSNEYITTTSQIRDALFETPESAIYSDGIELGNVYENPRAIHAAQFLPRSLQFDEYYKPSEIRVNTRIVEYSCGEPIYTSEQGASNNEPPTVEFQNAEPSSSYSIDCEDYGG